VGVVQCIKSGSWHTGEQKAAAELGIEWHAMGDGFTWDSDDLEKTAELGRAALLAAKDKLASGAYDLLILDELTYAITFGWVTVDDVVAGVRDRAPKTNVVITGRNAPPELIELADTVTEMVKVKHAYDQGISARKGLEY
jgi:cob(I)alamin adenosyltransferase